MKYNIARIIEHNCQHVINRFELVSLAALRAEEINSGSNITINHNEDDKIQIIALKEITTGIISVPELREKLILKHQTQSHNLLHKPQQDKLNNTEEYFTNFDSSSEFNSQQIDFNYENLSIINDKK
ncbi:DNA-directed RNA polymerase, omega subunit [Orientia chuto str. Dubai]|uniref:DNA-directed RNA polymerase subunit omega n=1 Tax=Orientia chuto str. Dubai TaxID=1359168 RepID=A0A0F3MN21_9RICK|nr:DNA-directed RNA polymerase subunit omega [Candidatus Orientia mediorientalis]KJV56004.1 DNA-directed RNA polymerase, omega subunit [Orientia chuto str. Dubai]